MDKEATVLQLFRAVSLHKTSEIKKLTKKLAAENSTHLLLTTLSSESEKNTVLHAAAKHGCNDLVDVILKTSSLSPLLRAKNSRGNTPMHNAAASGHARVITSLIGHVQKADQENGANKDLQDMLTEKNEQGNTPVHEAAGKGHSQVVEMLVKLLNPNLLVRVLNEVNKVGETPLSLAITAKSSSTVKTILKAEPSISSTFRGPHNQTILHMTILKQDSETMQVILQNRPKLAKEKDANGRSPLHYAAALGHHRLIRSLLKYDASTAYIVDDTQMLPIHLAVTNNDNILIVSELYKNGPTTMEFTGGNRKQNVLHMAAQNGNVDVVTYLLQLPEIEELINSVDEDGNTPLRLSFNNGHNKVVKLFFKDPRVYMRAINRKEILDTFSKVHQTASSCNGKDPENEQQHLGKLFLKRDPKTASLCNDKDPENEQQHLVELFFKEDPKTASSCNDKDPENEQQHLVELFFKEDPKEEEKALRDCIMNQAENIEDILGLPGHSTRARPGIQPVDRKLKDTAGVVMLVATLVTTVTFALAFQIPGGYTSDDDPHKGMAVLSLKNKRFQGFVMLDATAMVSSALATLTLLFALWLDNHKIFVRVLTSAMLLTSWSLFIVTAAYIRGLMVVFETEKESRLNMILGCAFIMPIVFWLIGFAIPGFAKVMNRRWTALHCSDCTSCLKSTRIIVTDFYREEIEPCVVTPFSY